ncbi:phage tail protein [Salmonella enterica subsp. enterica serovar Eastbourne]|uniref:Phage tail protein n=1 Tax=Salmonella enterica subsp. enterica serovar Eastbourne TaxID=486993 RepID=A0A702BAP5_SALET|nr:phage tail protein [Salmonella enterica subsp. enterica serovar Eastbourne]ECA1898086.1 phage tail protein [Salmonella enterica subsp. enterica serovar Eastbourne]HAC6674893.1 phage tail protein [Salmonella enterica subsp. enterica serovar Eastbourne]HAE5115442.1 phage tail protein [Salmonella enterica subsp. enterica serovar Eastbourne]HAE8026545.1 phage tail protein [Salmonella enterica subsp. enterica serovar Eastbourne]
MIAIAQQGDTVDAICWRYFGTTQGVTEEVYRINPGLAETGPLLRQGQAVILPDVAPAQEKTLIQLWD